MILPGFPMPLLMGKTDPMANYESALTSITNKTLLLRADQISGFPDGSFVTAWGNEGSVGGSMTAPATAYQIHLKGQNGLHYLKKAGAGSFSSSLNFAGIKGPDITHTVFFAGRMPTADPLFVTFIGENFGTYSVRILGAGNIRLVCGNASPAWDTGQRPSNGQDFVFGLKVNSTSSQRLNFNGAITPGSEALTNPTTLSTANLNTTDDTNTVRYYEVIVSSDAVSDADMDAMVSGLMGKWGIS